ncbi:MAG: energy-coupling factor transporter transmembrane component T family protein [Candidatus Heimdallarchaeaceae archaeon]
MSYMIKRIYQGLLFKADSIKFHPYVGLIVVIVQFGFLISSNNLVLLTLLTFTILENGLYKNARGALSIIYAIIPLVIFLGGISYIFVGLPRAFRTVLRVIIGGLSFSFFFAVTNPSDLTRSLEKLHFPASLAFLPSLVLTLSPRISKDADETLETLRLRGVMKGFAFTWLPKMIAIFIASVIYRSEFLAQALYYKGFGVQKRTHYRKIPFHWVNYIRLLTWIIFSVLYFFITKYFPSFLEQFLTAQ